MAGHLERAAANDLTTLATDKGQVPMNIGALLRFAPGPDPAATVAVMAERLAAVPRMRQRLLRPGPGAGAPFWVADRDFRLEHHVCPAGTAAMASRDALLDLAAELVCTRLPADRPLWALRWTHDPDTGDLAVVIVLHHVLADGMGGLAVLAALADGSVPAPQSPARVPRRREVLLDANRRRWATARNTGPALRRALAGLREMGLDGGPPTLVARCSILQPTSGRRTVRTVSCDVAGVVAAGRRAGTTVNDAVLAAVAGALFEVLADRGEHPADLVISVPVSVRRRASASDLGNQVGAVPIAVPNHLDPVARLQAVAERAARAKGQQRGSSAIVLSWLFRALAAVRLGQYFIDHQRLVHTFETNLRGPSQPLTLAGADLVEIVPIAVNPGNVGVSFDVLSYAGRLTITVVADPRTVPEVDRVAALVKREVEILTGSAC